MQTKNITLLAFLFICVTSFSQNDFQRKKPISIGYFGHYYFHPGIKIGTQYDWRSWEKVKEKKKGPKTKLKSLFISPQLGFYSHFGNHAGLLLNADFGYQRIKMKRGFYSAYSIGLGLINHINAGTTYIPQEDGSLKKRNLAGKLYFMPSLNYEFGQQVNEKIGWYGKMTLASKMPYNTSISAETFIEIGVKMNLGNF